MDLMSVYIKCNDEVSLLVLEQDWWKSFYRLNRFAKNSNFSEQPVRALNLSTDAKQKIKENLTLYRFRCERIVVCGKTRPKKQPQVSKIRALNGLNSKTYYICHPIFFMNQLEIFQRLIAWLFCLDELQCFACRFFLQFFVTWQVFWWVINKVR